MDTLHPGLVACLLWLSAVLLHTERVQQVRNAFWDGVRRVRVLSRIVRRLRFVMLAVACGLIGSSATILTLPLGQALVLILLAYLAFILIDLPTWLLLWPALLAVVGSGGDRWAMAAWALLVSVILAGPIARLWLIPRGLVKPTFFVLSEMAQWATADAVVMALRAWRNSRRDAADLDWLYRRLVPRALNPSAVVAAGLLQAARGNGQQARAWMESVTWLSVPTMRGVRVWRALRHGHQWLCADAAERGAWAEVEQYSRRTWGSAILMFLRGIAQWRLGLPGRPSLARLTSLSRFVPAELRGGMALAAEVPPLAAEVPPVPLDRDPVERALALHLAAERATDVQALRDLGHAWDVALAHTGSPQELSLLDRSDLARDWREQVVSEMVELLRTTPADVAALGRSSGVLEVARRRLRDEMMADVERRASALHARKEVKQAIPPIEEWEEWMLTRQAYQRVVSRMGRESVHLLWGRIHGHVCNYGVWLFNERQQRMLSHHIFNWLLEEATVMGDQKSIDLQTRNKRVTSGWLF